MNHYNEFKIKFYKAILSNDGPVINLRIGVSPTLYVEQCLQQVDLPYMCHTEKMHLRKIIATNMGPVYKFYSDNRCSCHTVELIRMKCSPEYAEFFRGMSVILSQQIALEEF